MSFTPGLFKVDIADFGHRSSSLRNISIEAGKCNWYCFTSYFRKSIQHDAILSFVSGANLLSFSWSINVVPRSASKGKRNMPDCVRSCFRSCLSLFMRKTLGLRTRLAVVMYSLSKSLNTRGCFWFPTENIHSQF